MPQQEEARRTRDAQAALLVLVARHHGNLGHHGADGVEPEEQVRLEEVALAELVEGQLARHRAVEGGEAVRRIEDLPVARGELGEEGEDRVAEQPHPRHRLEVVGAVEAVALGVVRRSVEDRRDEPRDEPGIHLAVPVDLDQHVRAVAQRLAVAREHRAADAPLPIVAEHLHAGVPALGLDEVARAIRTAVVHDVDPRHLGADRAEHVQDLLRDAEAGDHHGDDWRALRQTDLALSHGAFGSWHAARRKASRPTRDGPAHRGAAGRPGPRSSGAGAAGFRRHRSRAPRCARARSRGDARRRSGP